MKNHKNPKYSYSSTCELQELRESQSLTLQYVGRRFFNLKGTRPGNTVRNWELGKRKPHERKRANFLSYLVDGLKITHKEVVIQIWNKIMVHEWLWEPLKDQELYDYYKPRSLVADKKYVFMAPKSAQGLVGRDNELDALYRSLLLSKTIAVCAVRGMPGVGKTSLAMALANDARVIASFTSGVIWVGVGKDPNHLNTLKDICSEIGMLNEIGNETELLAISKLIKRKISVQKYLIVIDDVWDSNDAFLYMFGGPNCAHLITTRSPMIATQTANDNVKILAELNHAESVELLCKYLPENTEYLTYKAELDHIVLHTGGLPLAIVLVGHFLQIEILEEAQNDIKRAFNSVINQLARIDMQNDLSLVQAPLNPHPSLIGQSKMTLANIIKLGYEILTEDAKTLLRILSILSPKPNTITSEEVFGLAKDNQRSVSILESSGLLEPMRRESEKIYAIHPCIQEFSMSQVAITSDHVICLQNFYLSYLQKNPLDYPKINRVWLNLLEVLSVWQNVSDMRVYDLSIKIILLLAKYVKTYGKYKDIIHILKSIYVRAVEESGKDEEFINLSHFLAQVLMQSAQYEEAISIIEYGVKIVRDIKNDDLMALLLNIYAPILIVQGKQDVAQSVLTTVINLDLRPNSNELFVAYCHMGNLYFYEGDFAKAEKYYKQSIQFKTDETLLTNLCDIHINLAATKQELGLFQECYQVYREARAIAEKEGYQEGLVFIEMNMGSSALDQKNYSLAEQHLCEARDLMKDTGYREAEFNIYLLLGRLYTYTNRLKEAQAWLIKGKSIAIEIGRSWAICVSYSNFVEYYIEVGDYGQALHYQQLAAEVATNNNHIGELHWVMYLKAVLILAVDGDRDLAIQTAKKGLKYFSDNKQIVQATEIQDWIDKVSLSNN